jgi:aromatic-amino-acid transaminase
VRKLLFGASSDVVENGRVVTVQALGGTGALKIGADFLRRFAPARRSGSAIRAGRITAHCSEGAGFTVNCHPLFRRRDERSRFCRDGRDAGKDSGGLHPRSACVLPQSDRRRSDSVAVGRRIVEIVRARALIPFLDLAYQGFADGIEADGAVVREFVATPARCCSRARSRSRSRSTASASARCRWLPAIVTRPPACFRN